MEVQIWRVNVQGQDDGISAANVLIQRSAFSVADPCNGEVDPPNILTSMSGIQAGSENIDVGAECVPDGDCPQPFDVKDGNDNVIHSGCTFTGSGTYIPDSGGEGDGDLVAGTMQCVGGFTVKCLRPVNNLATTCGGQALNSCGSLGKDCRPFYQQLAICRV